MKWHTKRGKAYVIDCMNTNILINRVKSANTKPKTDYHNQKWHF